MATSQRFVAAAGAETRAGAAQNPSTLLSANTDTARRSQLDHWPQRHCVDQLADKFLMGPARASPRPKLRLVQSSIAHHLQRSSEPHFEPSRGARELNVNCSNRC